MLARFRAGAHQVGVVINELVAGLARAGAEAVGPATHSRQRS